MKKTFCDFCGQEIHDVPVSNTPTTDFASLKLSWDWGRRGIMWELHEDCAKQLFNRLEGFKTEKAMDSKK